MENTPSRRGWGIFCCIAGSLLMSLHAPLVKFINIDPLLMAFLRPLIAAAALLPFVRLKRVRLGLDAALMCLFFAAQCLLMILALKHTSAAVAVSMQFTSPVWLFLIERKNGARLTLLRLWPLGLLLAGIVLLMCSDAEGVTLAGNLYALATSFTYAGLIYFSKRAACTEPLSMAAICCLFMALALLPFQKDPLSAIAAISSTEWIALAALGVFQTAAAYGLYYNGLRYIPASTASMVSPAEMIGGPLWVAIFLHIIPSALEICALVIVLAGVVGEVAVSSAE